MRRVEHSFYFLPNRNPRGKPYRSSWKMSAEEAAARGALGIVPGSTEVREIPETEEEVGRSQVNYQSAGHDGAKPPRR